MTLTVVDLFCGCGGFSLGFDYAGFKIIFALDNWKVACESYQANFPDVEVLCENALNLSPDDIPDADIIIGSPPCQDFSIANLKKKYDTTLIDWFWDVVREKKPKYVIMEEVPPVKRFLPSDVPMVRIYRMCDYGVPQIRRRLFAGWFVEPAKYPINVVFPAVMATEWKGSSGPRQMARLSSIFRRKSLIPEAKLVQTFPLDYILCGSLKEQYEQIGNAVPPLMSYRLAEAIKLREEGLITLEEVTLLD
ncbi:DNA cytosine methyltransferase [Archaeoglobus sp.]